VVSPDEVAEDWVPLEGSRLQVPTATRPVITAEALSLEASQRGRAMLAVELDPADNDCFRGRRRRQVPVTYAPRRKPESLIAELEGLGITRGIVRQMVAVGQIIELRCEMPKCYYHKGRRSFEMKRHPPAQWQLLVDHYPILARDGGRMDPWNVRLGHVLCNRYDYGWRVRIRDA
jgi:hypothetical protein